MLPLHKPVGLSSNDALQKLRRSFGIGSAGHDGTLDPFAEGVLCCYLEEATKLIPFLEEAEKEYEALALIGFVLFFITLMLNVIALSIVRRYREQYD